MAAVARTAAAVRSFRTMPDNPEQDSPSPRIAVNKVNHQPPPAVVDEEAQQEAADQTRADDANHDVHQDAGSAAFDDLAGDPARDNPR